MYCTRPVSRSPSVYRIVTKPATAAPARNASFFHHPFFARSPANELAPFLRLLDDFASPTLAPAYTQHARQQLGLQTPPAPAATASFNPRFDVREVDQSYELRGEVPGVDSQDLHVEFSDPQTLVIRGRTERDHSNGTPAATESAAAAAQDVAEQSAEETAEDHNSDAASTYSTGSYQKPSVEEGEDVAAAESSADAQARPAATPAESTNSAAPKQHDVVASKPEQSQPHYWVSERSTGTFQRVFKFPARVDQDGVRASLKNGILEIVVPKAQAPVVRRIQVE